MESTSAVNEEMPVEKILEAEMAVEQKTELHADGSSGGSSVSLGWSQWLPLFCCIKPTAIAMCSSVVTPVCKYFQVRFWCQHLL